jgi:protein involved in polysaccharide export with SLBB domain
MGSRLLRGVTTCTLAAGFSFVIYGGAIEVQNVSEIDAYLEKIAGGANEIRNRFIGVPKKTAAAAVAVSPAAVAIDFTPEGSEAGLIAETRLEVEPAAAPAIPDACRAAMSLIGAVRGDKIHLRLFEYASFRPVSDAAAAAPDAQEIAFERLDLSGVYEVDGAGDLALPFLGRMAVLGRDLPCVEAEVGRRYTELQRSRIAASANYASRPPVVANGSVRSPGVYQFSPGMTVSHLIALAGAPADGGIQAAHQQAELFAQTTEIERLTIGVELEMRRIEAALERRRDIGLTESERTRIARLLGPDRVESEIALLVAEIDEVEALEAENQAQLAAFDDRIARIEQHLAVIDDHYARQSERLDELRGFQERGFASMMRLDSGEAGVMALERARLTAMSELVQLRAERDAVERSVELDAASRRERLSREIRDRREERNALDAQQASIDIQLASLDPNASGGGAATKVQFVLHRPSGEGVERLQARPSTKLAPGDVVTVSIALSEQVGLAEQLDLAAAGASSVGLIASKGE